MLTQRCYTYVPGEKAYQIINKSCDDNEVDDEDEEEQVSKCLF